MNGMAVYCPSPLTESPYFLNIEEPFPDSFAQGVVSTRQGSPPLSISSPELTVHIFAAVFSSDSTHHLFQGTEYHLATLGTGNLNCRRVFPTRRRLAFIFSSASTRGRRGSRVCER